jgi:hypothetical protein
VLDSGAHRAGLTIALTSGRELLRERTSSFGAARRLAARARRSKQSRAAEQI